MQLLFFRQRRFKKTFDMAPFSHYFGLEGTFHRRKGGTDMIWNLPSGRSRKPDDSALCISLNMTFDVPAEIAEQLELWGLNTFQKSEYDQDYRQLKVSAQTTLYRKGA